MGYVCWRLRLIAEANLYIKVKGNRGEMMINYIICQLKANNYIAVKLFNLKWWPTLHYLWDCFQIKGHPVSSWNHHKNMRTIWKLNGDILMDFNCFNWWNDPDIPELFVKTGGIAPLKYQNPTLLVGRGVPSRRTQSCEAFVFSLLLTERHVEWTVEWSVIRYKYPFHFMLPSCIIC